MDFRALVKIAKKEWRSGRVSVRIKQGLSVYHQAGACVDQAGVDYTVDQAGVGCRSRMV